MEFGKVLHFPGAPQGGSADCLWDMQNVRNALEKIENGVSSEHLSKVGKTLDEIDRNNFSSIPTACDSKDMPPPFALEFANSLWIQRDLSLREEYLKTIGEYYKGNEIFIEPDLIKAGSEINSWISERTGGHIKDAFRATRSNEDNLRLVVINAIYFLGEWQEPFNEMRTKERDFILASLDTIRTMTMEQRIGDSARYAAFNEDGTYFQTPHSIINDIKEGLYPRQNGFFIIELPYRDCGLSMIVIAPQSPNGLGEIESRFSPETLSSWIDKLERRSVNVIMPRFEIDSERELKLDLKKIGLEAVFGIHTADLSGISKEPLYVSGVFHKAWLRVDEKGSEAAAATVAKIAITASITSGPKPFIPVFRADRPFLLAIRDRGSDLIFFMGRLSDPRSAGNSALRPGQ